MARHSLAEKLRLVSATVALRALEYCGSHRCCESAVQKITAMASQLPAKLVLKFEATMLVEFPFLTCQIHLDAQGFVLTSPNLVPVPAQILEVNFLAFLRIMRDVACLTWQKS